MRIEIELTEQEWEVLRPLLEPKMLNAMPSEPKYVDYEYLSTLSQGTRICNILKDGEWKRFPNGCIIYEHELKSISRAEFLRHRCAGGHSWDVLKCFINTL